MCLIIGSGINRVIAGDPELQALCYNDLAAAGTLLTNGSHVMPEVGNDGLTSCEHVKVQLAITIAFMSGLIMVCVCVCVYACVRVCTCVYVCACVHVRTYVPL